MESFLSHSVDEVDGVDGVDGVDRVVPPADGGTGMLG